MSVAKEAVFAEIDILALAARQASRELMSLGAAQKNAALARIAALLAEKQSVIQAENRKDVALAQEKGVAPAMIDRLTLSDAVFAQMIQGVQEVIALPDPVGAIEAMQERPSGIVVGRMRVPLGVIAMIYESRPNVTIDAATLCLKAGNAVILRGGSEAIHSNLALAAIIREALSQEHINPDAAQVVPTTDRKAVERLLTREEQIDLVIPRGGEGLIRFVCERSRIPVLKHYKGVCHIYVDKDADLQRAIPIIMNAKTQRPGVCNALEGLLIHEDIAADFLPKAARSLTEAGVVIKGCPRSCALSADCLPAQDDDWGREFLALALVVKVVSGFAEAKAYIERHGSQHTESIITENYTTAKRFIREIDASAVMVNASTRFNDGGQFGLGAEIGISTTKLHAYGPMGLEELTTRKFVVFGEGQIRA
ncbi:MAG: glutamate-5-semialdehyde dehydrogenase [Desulfobulbaceae bacterium]|jgi:glutamate-5-semialdehyde dehydrogenase|nr:glutamate-5-semialdehyde dehydrogenase [Desulfobulbaceae bacterium]